MSRRWLKCLTIIVSVGTTAAVCTGPPPGCDDGSGKPIFSVGTSSPLAQTGSADCFPPPPCANCGGGTGEPHITTFDGQRYDYQGAAEVIAARSPDGTFEVQWRQEPVEGKQVARITAVAIKMGVSRVTVLGRPDEVRVDGALVSLVDDEPLVLPSGATLHRDGEIVMLVSEDRTTAVHATTRRSMMTVLVDPPDDFLGRMEGLLGNADAERGNDVVLADGRVLDQPRWDDVHPALGEAWRVSDGMSLFDYQDGVDAATYWDPSFPAREARIDDFGAEAQQAAQTVCFEAGVTDPDILTDCIYDVLVTGDDSTATVAAIHQLARGMPLGGDDEALRADASTSGDPPLVVWDRGLAGLSVERGTRDIPLGLDHDGHLLVQAWDGRDHVLIALDADGGDIAWTRPDVSASCGVATLNDGRIVGQLRPRSDTGGPRNDNADLVVIDAVSGALLDGFRYSPAEADPDLDLCVGSILEAEDGRVVLYDASGLLWGLTIGLDTIDVAWTREVGSFRDAMPPVVSSDTAAVYVARPTEAQGFVIDRMDALTGDVSATSDTMIGPAPLTRLLVTNGDVFVSTKAGPGTLDPDALLRLSGTSLEEVWRLDFSQPVEIDGETLGKYGFRSLESAGDWIVGIDRDDGLVAVDTDSGSPLWLHRPASGTVARIVVGPTGTSYLTSDGDFSIEAVGADGQLIEAVRDEPLQDAYRAIVRHGPAAAGGLLYVVAPGEDDDQLHVLAVRVPGPGF